MTFVVTEPCFNCKHTECVEVCPCESFHEGETMVFINPESCIDCGACQVECPTDAIFPEHEVPDRWHDYILLNAEMVPSSPVITDRKQPLAE